MNSEESFIEDSPESSFNEVANKESEATGEAFFFDTYAFYEIIKGNKNYERYLFSGIITTKLNIFEIYHAFLKDNNKDLADFSLKNYYQFSVDFDENVIIEAAKMKKDFNKRDLSMSDCIGYTLAKYLRIKFLTGDKQFYDMDNVEYVK
ncbi:PIN domain-containing protein [Candidatus Pacearchaeota archaeon]|nr:PIN domain-containing protein [Candidatus Pacearchaeota archaeon]